MLSMFPELEPKVIEMSTSNRIETGTFDGRTGYLEPASAPTFTFTFHGAPFGQGGESTSTHILLPEEETEAFLKKNEQSDIYEIRSYPVTRVDINTLASNEPGQDRHDIRIVCMKELSESLQSVRPWWEHLGKMGGKREGRGWEDLVLASVFDGNGETANVSVLLEKTLHGCLALALEQVDRADPDAFAKAISDT